MSFTLSKAALGRVKRRDRVARWVVTLGGVAVIICVAAILVLIVATTLPLFQFSRVEVLAERPLPAGLAAADVMAVGIEMGVDAGKLLVGHVLSREGNVAFLDLSSGKLLKRLPAAPPGCPAAKSIRAVERVGPADYSLIWSDGTISLLEVGVETAAGRGRKGPPLCTVHTRATIPAEKGPLPLRAVMRTNKDKEVSSTCVALLPENRILLIRQVREENELTGEATTKTQRTLLKPQSASPIGPLAIDAAGKTIYAGTSDGALVWWRLADDGQVSEQDIIPAFHDRRAITALALLFGDVSLAVGDDQGGLSTWFFVHTGVGQSRKLRLIHTLQSHPAAVCQIVPAQRNKALLSFDKDGAAAVDYLTSQRHLASIGDNNPRGAPPLEQTGMSSRADAVLGLDAAGELRAWRIRCPHPEISMQTLFGKVHYEGYDEPDYVWQSGGGEDYEPKMSLTPLLFGTLKATIYAMFLAVPLSLAAAAYVSHFASPALKQWIKPTVEIMAALPSVVIGFIIALWLAPIVQSRLASLLAALLVLPVVLLLFLFGWQAVRKRLWVRRLAHGREFIILAPVLLAGVALACWIGPAVERLLPEASLTQCLTQNLHLRFDQRNSIIIAIGLGFAVIPIIFSLAEDSLSNIPHSMTAASMALGASRWQTLWRVVVPSASPGIFAAVMIGFGRAVGETMIVLMATGNTPLMDWTPLDGMRTLSANIAVEIPEAPVPDVGVPGTLYRVLFLCAVLLFVVTFILNTVAELVRQRLRKRYGQY